MLIANQLCGFGTRVFGGSLHDILGDLGLTANLRISLDAGDAASYTSGQKWLDRTANGLDFFRGADGTATTDDPTFNGTAGGLSSSEYWSFDGGDFFRLDQANPTWVDAMHKDGAQWSAIAAVHIPSGAHEAYGFMGTTGGEATAHGMYWVVKNANDKQNVAFLKGANPAAMDQTATATITEDAWNIVGVSVDENGGASASVFHTNGTNDTFDGAATSPSTSAATYTLDLASVGNGGGGAGWIAPNTSRMACVAIWEGTVLSGADFTALWDAMRGRFGL